MKAKKTGVIAILPNGTPKGFPDEATALEHIGEILKVKGQKQGNYKLFKAYKEIKPKAYDFTDIIHTVK